MCTKKVLLFSILNPINTFIAYLAHQIGNLSKSVNIYQFEFYSLTVYDVSNHNLFKQNLNLFFFLYEIDYA